MSDYIIKEAILNEEKEKIRNFLSTLNLQYENDINYSLYMVDSYGDIIATISLSDYIIKCLAVSNEHEDENLESELINKLIEKLKNDNKFYYLVFSLIKYESLFINLGFKKIASTDKTIILEYGSPSIDVVLDRLKNKIETTLDCKLDSSRVCSIVINADPFTNGHLSLVEEGIVRRYDCILVFVVSDNKGFFNEKERLSLAYVSLLPYDNVIVVPSTRYIISEMTFPNCYLDNNKSYNDLSSYDKNEEWAKLDALIFRDYFMEKLNISKRFLGSEIDHYMVQYNNVLKEVLGDKVEIIDRIKLGDKPIRAKDVREHIINGNMEEVQRLVPRGSWMFYKQILERYKHLN